MSASFCWWCDGQLVPGKYLIVKDQLGHEHRVHCCCQKDAARELKGITAQPRQRREEDND